MQKLAYFRCKVPRFFYRDGDFLVYVPHVLTYGSGIGAHPVVTEAQHCAHISAQWSPQGRRPPSALKKLPIRQASAECRLYPIAGRGAQNHIFTEKK